MNINILNSTFTLRRLAGSEYEWSSPALCDTYLDFLYNNNVLQIIIEIEIFIEIFTIFIFFTELDVQCAMFFTIIAIMEIPF